MEFRTAVAQGSYAFTPSKQQRECDERTKTGPHQQQSAVFDVPRPAIGMYDPVTCIKRPDRLSIDLGSQGTGPRLTLKQISGCRLSEGWIPAVENGTDKGISCASASHKRQRRKCFFPSAALLHGIMFAFSELSEGEECHGHGPWQMRTTRLQRHQLWVPYPC